MSTPAVVTIVVSRRKPVPYVIWLGIGIHVVWALSLIFNPLVAPAAILVGLHWVLSLGIDGRALGAVLLIAAAMAAAALIIEERISRLMSLGLLLPQYALLIGALVSDSESVLNATVDGRAVDRDLLFTALWPVMLMAILHSVSIVERHWTWTHR